MAAAFVSALLASAMVRAGAQGGQDSQDVEMMGTIVSIRGGILVLRPSLRPVLTRFSVGPKTAVFSFERSSIGALKPGLRIRMGGRYSKEGGFHPFFLEAAEPQLGSLTEHSNGLKDAQEGGFVMITGNLKSVQPFVFTDDEGKEYTAKIENLRGVFHDVPSDPSQLLIGVRVRIVGKRAPDGVVQASRISPDRNFSATGSMFGEILGMQGNTLQIRPRYTTDTLQVVCPPGCDLMRQITIDPDTIKVGDTVTFWGQQRNHPGDQPRSTDLLATALILGERRYPKAEGDEGGVFLTGKIASLEPSVKLALRSGEVINVIIPAQMPVARLEPIRASDLKSGTQAMLVLTRRPDGSFVATHVILDASPWVGYGG
jgi:hypothetical protein